LTSSISRYVEHTLLDPEATGDDIDRLAAAAVEHDLFAICLAPTWVRRARAAVDGTNVSVVTVAGFPTGAHRSEIKAAEAVRGLDDGAVEVDMVVDLGAVRARAWDAVRRDVERTVQAVRPAPVKAIVETARFDAGRIVSAARAAVEAGAAFVKTGTGFAGGATLEAVELLRRVVGPDVGIKAAGGIRSHARGQAFLKAGADRLGTSHGPAVARD